MKDEDDWGFMAVLCFAALSREDQARSRQLYGEPYFARVGFIYWYSRIRLVGVVK